MNEEREWTVMFYLASDNPLAPGTITHLKAIKNAGYHPEVNVLAQFDPHTVNMPVHIFDVNRIEKLKHPNKANIGFNSNDPFVRNLVTDKIWTSEVNEQIKEALENGRVDIPFDPPLPPDKMTKELSPRDSLEEFLKFCQEHYPARHYMLFIVGHGVIVGNDLFLHDENVGTTRQGNRHPTSLSLIELANILRNFNERLSADQQLEMIGFHACSMSGVEVAFELEELANYMLAAQGPTYNGAWPYRQILIRLFNDLNSGSRFTQEEVRADGLIDVLKDRTDPFSRFFLRRFNRNNGAKEVPRRVNGNGAKDVLDGQIDEKQAEQEFVGVLTHGLNSLLADPNLSREVRRIKLPATRKDRLPTMEADEKALRRFNRQLILSALPPKVARADTQFKVKRLCKKIFNYCLFNSFDFQLAGYSCDLTLCDLNKIGDLREPISNLVESLIQGLRFSRTKNPLIRELMVLAHWEAQSFFQDQYTDLYDYCFRLRDKCEFELARMQSSRTQEVLENIRDACEAVMRVLKRGTDTDDNGVIVRSEFSGPHYQYTHGLSVFFPWSEPVNNPMWKKLYKRFAFRETGWHNFLKVYFDKTMRKPEGDEVNEIEPPPPPPRDLDRRLLELLQAMATQVFGDGQLGSSGSRDPMGSVGSRDPQGGDCDCQSIKNYPSITHSKKKSLTGYNRQAINWLRQLNREFSNRR